MTGSESFADLFDESPISEIPPTLESHREDDVPPTPPLQTVHYTVKLYKHNDQIGMFRTGHVVTYLSLKNWCEVNGYTVLKLYTTRIAKPGELTELF